MQRRAGSRPIQSTKLGEYETKLGKYGVCRNASFTFLQMYKNCSKCAIFNPRRIFANVHSLHLVNPTAGTHAALP